VSVVSVGLVLAGNVLSIDGSFLFVFVSIFVLIFLLNRTLFKPINQLLDERDRLGAGRLAESKGLLARYEERLAGYEESLRVARSAAFSELEVARREALARRSAAIEEVRAETTGLVATAKEDIARQAVQVRETLDLESRAMAASISAKILNRPVSSGGTK